MEDSLITNQPKSLVAYFRLVKKQGYLIRSFAWRNLREVYSGRLQGFLTSFLQPLVTIIFFSVFFGLLIHLQTPGVQYPLYAFSGMIIWNLFSMSFMDVMTSLNKYGSVITKMYFPRIIIPISAMANAVLVALVSFGLLIIACLCMGQPVSAWMALFPIFIILTLMFSFSLALFFSYKSVKKRELLYVMPGIIGFGSWLTPIFYPISLLPQEYIWMIFLNPLTFIAEGFRWSLLGTPMPPWQYAFILFIPLTLLIIFIIYFVKKERYIADYI